MVFLSLQHSAEGTGSFPYTASPYLQLEDFLSPFESHLYNTLTHLLYEQIQRHASRLTSFRYTSSQRTLHAVSLKKRPSWIPFCSDRKTFPAATWKLLCSVCPSTSSRAPWKFMVYTFSEVCSYFSVRLCCFFSSALPPSGTEPTAPSLSYWVLVLPVSMQLEEGTEPTVPSLFYWVLVLPVSMQLEEDFRPHYNFNCLPTRAPCFPPFQRFSRIASFIP